MRSFILLPASATVFAALILLNGCGPSATPPAASTTPATATPVDPHDVPLTEDDIAKLREDVAQYSVAITRIKTYRENIRIETKDGLPANPLKAHRALDELDRVLEWLPEIASKSGVAKDHWEAVTTTSQELRELFNKVHTNLDNKQSPDYAAIEGGVNQGITKLEGFTPTP